MAKRPVGPAAAELAKNMLAEVAASAHAWDRQAFHMSIDGKDKETLLRDYVMRTEVCRMGWVAERALILLGGEALCSREGKAENWLMPDSCREMTKF